MGTLQADDSLLNGSTVDRWDSRDAEYESLFQRHIALKVKLAAEAQENDEAHIRVFELTHQLQLYEDRVATLENALIELRREVTEAAPDKMVPRSRKQFWSGLFKTKCV